jgi:hypothetical protein
MIFSNADDQTIEKSSLRRTAEPQISGTTYFNHKFLNTVIRLKKIDGPISISLYEDSEGNELIWNCHHPKALADITHNGNIFTGLGYAETLSCPINPLKLPMKELRWGRFLSDSHTVIWINWKSDDPLNKVFLDGTEFNDAFFENDTLVFDNERHKLTFSEIRTIRNGKLSGLFSKMKYLKFFFNSRLLETVETKFKAKTILTGDSAFLSTGWSLFEIVKWGK